MVLRASGAAAVGRVRVPGGPALVLLVLLAGIELATY
jgi:hypothetical protein